MTICFYADLYVIFNFIMNLFLLYITAFFRQKRCSGLRILAASFTGAFFSLFLTYFLKGNVTLIGILLSFFEIILIVKIGFRYEGFRVMCGDVISFLGISLFTSGALIMVKNFTDEHIFGNRQFSFWLLLLSVVLLFVIFLFTRFFLLRSNFQKKSVMRVRIMHHGKETEVAALYDTGNQLVSPYTGEGVAIISKKLAKTLCVEEVHAPILIPYHSIGGEGMLKAYRIEYLEYEGGGCKKDFLAAVSDSLCTDDKIQIILNIT